MKFRCERDVLADVLATAGRAATGRTGALPVLSGVRIELQHIHATLEQGGSTFKDDQSLYQNGGINRGYVDTPVLGQTMSLGSLLAEKVVQILPSTSLRR